MSPPRKKRSSPEALEDLRKRLVEAERAATGARVPKARGAQARGVEADPAKPSHRKAPRRRAGAGGSLDAAAGDAEPDWPPAEDPEEDWDEPAVSARWWDHETAGKPRPVAGGLAARTKKGQIGSSWWSRRFLDSLESVMAGGRMGRGRTYARKGQVAKLEIRPGEVVASVQGSREEPYDVRLRMPVVPAGDWDKIIADLAASAGHAARMLAGDLPHEVEEVFEAEGASLLPAPHARLVTECSCPDWENPCKHIAAVCYLVAEEFDRDPFSLLTWRGRGKRQLLEELRALRLARAATDPGSDPVQPAPGQGEELAGSEETGGAPGGARTDDDPRDPFERFWSAGPALAHVRVRPDASAMPAAALRLAARGLLAARGGDLVDVLAPLYEVLADRAAARARR